MTAPAAPSYAVAVQKVCPDGTIVSVEMGTTPEAFTINADAACRGHEGAAGSNGSNGANTVTSQGHWEWTGYVCDNGGTCASNLACADGTPVMTFVFVGTDGEPGESQTYCPGDAALPTLTPTLPPTPDELADALASVEPPVPVLDVQPPGRRTLVNLETIFSTTAEPWSTPSMLLVPGWRVVFHLEPVSYRWHFGDGETQHTDWSGEPWHEGADLANLITHVYERTGTAATSVEVTWGATASLNGRDPIRVPGTVTAISEDLDLEILEATPQLVMR